MSLDGVEPAIRRHPSYLGLVSPDAPTACDARVQVLCLGTTRGGRLTCTVGLARDGDVCVVIDPGMIAGRGAVLRPLAAAGVRVETVTDVVFSRADPVHTLNAALFPRARCHDSAASYDGGERTFHDGESLDLSPSIRLVLTPGGPDGQVTTLAATPDGIVAFTHLWHTGTLTLDDVEPRDLPRLQAARRRVLRLASHIVPGHAADFRPGPDTPV